MHDLPRPEGAIEERLARVRERIAAAARRSGRPPEAVQLVAVGKTFPAAILQRVVDAGQKALGENRVQEAVQKASVIRGEVEWHLVGHLQRNKARQAARLFDWIHSVDSVRLAHRLAACIAPGLHPLRILLQVDLSGEATKSGVPVAELPGILEAVGALPGLRVRGLMVLPPALEPSRVRPFFRRLRELAEEGHRRGLLPESPELSMGMSGDFEVAVEEGATMVRVGSAIFGRRPTLKT
ncbi:MAG: YggS family pyridoxal phosphate-dependent enzyme [Acidobacteriota bacterium]